MPARIPIPSRVEQPTDAPACEDVPSTDTALPAIERLAICEPAASETRQHSPRRRLPLRNPEIRVKKYYFVFYIAVETVGFGMHESYISIESYISYAFIFSRIRWFLDP